VSSTSAQTRTDVHQHYWSEELLDQLRRRQAPPFVRIENGLAVLFLAAERPYVIDLSCEAPDPRRELLERDGLQRALLCLSSPLGIESLPRAESLALLDAYHDGAAGLGEGFGVWGAVPLEGLGPDDIDDVFARGCVGVSLPATALATVEHVRVLAPVLRRLAERRAPLMVHPGPSATRPAFADPLWWPALSCYVAQMQAAWLAFIAAGRSIAPSLPVVFAMLAGLAPLHAERLRSRGGPSDRAGDPLLFYDTSSYGPEAVRMVARVVGEGQILYGSDRPVVNPAELDMPWSVDWGQVAVATDRVLGARTVAGRQ
jgi:hypothetical protein